MMRIWKKTEGWKLPFLGLVGLTFALVSVLGRAAPPPKEPVVMPPVAPYERSVAGIGVIEPRSEMIAIGTELPGVVREVHVKAGDRVQKGDPLFSLDQRDIDAQIATLEIALASAKIQSEDADVQFKLIADLNNDGAIAKDDYNRRKYAAELGKSRVLEIAAQLQQAQVTKQRLTVAAPIDGTILDVNIRPGEFAAAGVLPEPLIRMGDTSTLHVRAEFDEENAARLSEDQQVRAFKRGDTAKTYALTFVRFEPFIAPKQNLAVAGQRVDTRVMQVIYALPAGSTDLFPGQQMDVFAEDIRSADLKQHD